MNVKMFQNGDLTNTSLMFLCNPLQININICFYFWDNASIFKVVLIKKSFYFHLLSAARPAPAWLVLTVDDRRPLNV